MHILTFTCLLLVGVCVYRSFATYKLCAKVYTVIIIIPWLLLGGAHKRQRCWLAFGEKQMYKANWMVQLGTAFPQLVQPDSTQVQLPRSRSLPPLLCNDITEGKIEKRERHKSN